MKSFSENERFNGVLIINFTVNMWCSVFSGAAADDRGGLGNPYDGTLLTSHAIAHVLLLRRNDNRTYWEQNKGDYPEHSDAYAEIITLIWPSLARTAATVATIAPHSCLLTKYRQSWRLQTRITYNDRRSINAIENQYRIEKMLKSVISTQIISIQTVVENTAWRERKRETSIRTEGHLSIA